MPKNKTTKMMMRLKLWISLLLFYATPGEEIYLSGSSIVTTKVEIPEKLQNMDQLGLIIEISDPHEGGAEGFGDSPSYVTEELQEEGVVFSVLEASGRQGQAKKVKMHEGDREKTLCPIDQKYISNAKHVRITSTNSLPYDKIIKFNLVDCPDKLMNIVVPVIIGIFILVIMICIFVVVFKKYLPCKKDPNSNDPEEQHGLTESLIKIRNPEIQENESGRYTDYQVSYKASSVRRRFNDFKWLLDELGKSGKVEQQFILILPPLPTEGIKKQLPWPFRCNDGIFDKHFIEKRRRDLESFVNKIAENPIAMKERCMQMFLHKDTIDKEYRNYITNMIGEFQMIQCSGFDDFLKEHGIKPEDMYIKISNETYPNPIQRITQDNAGKITITMETLKWENLLSGWKPCFMPPTEFHVDTPWEENTIYERETTTTATVKDNILVKTQIPKDKNQHTTKETREMMEDGETMRMLLTIPDKSEIESELIYKRVIPIDVQRQVSFAEEATEE